MGYVVKKLPNKQSHPKWKVQFSSRKKEYSRNPSAKYPSRSWDIPKTQWSGLGIRKDMSLEEAKARCHQLNVQRELKHKEEIRIKHKEKLELFEKEVCAYLPKAYKDEFEERYFYSRNARGIVKAKTLSHWRTAQKLILDLKLEPKDWFDHHFEVYDWLILRRYSPIYSRKILRVLNIWGFFLSKRLDHSFLPVPTPRGFDLTLLRESFFSKTDRRKDSAPTTPEQLEAAKSSLKQKHYNWLYLSVWLGLRPNEVDNLRNNAKVMIDQNNCSVLWVYQTKITSVPHMFRWKPIPIIYPQQEDALRILASKNSERPLVKTVRKYIGEDNTLYGGRKGFTDLMLSMGQSLENISQWLGHASLDRTWKNYKNKLAYHYSHPGIIKDVG